MFIDCLFVCLTNQINELNWKDNTVSYFALRFALLICGGPCHLFSFKQCSEDLIILWEQLVYSILEQIKHFYLMHTPTKTQWMKNKNKKNKRIRRRSLVPGQKPGGGLVSPQFFPLRDKHMDWGP